MDSVLIHDMRNVGQRLELLLSNIEEHYDNPDFKRSVVDLLNATVEKLDAIVSRASAHQDALLVKVSLDLNDLASEVVRQVRGRSHRSGPRVQTALGEVPPVLGDPYYLSDALANVYQNALEAVGGGGSVVVRTGTLSQRRRRWAVVEVADDGAGMPADFVETRLFRPFQTTKENGVGLGLYTARQIVQHHGGDIEVESRLGIGTTVRISLPASASTA